MCRIHPNSESQSLTLPYTPPRETTRLQFFPWGMCPRLRVCCANSSAVWISSSGQVHPPGLSGPVLAFCAQPFHQLNTKALHLLLTAEHLLSLRSRARPPTAPGGTCPIRSRRIRLRAQMEAQGDFPIDHSFSPFLSRQFFVAIASRLHYFYRDLFFLSPCVHRTPSAWEKPRTRLVRFGWRPGPGHAALRRERIPIFRRGTLEEHGHAGLLGEGTKWLFI